MIFEFTRDKMKFIFEKKVNFKVSDSGLFRLELFETETER